MGKLTNAQAEALRALCPGRVLMGEEIPSD